MALSGSSKKGSNTCQSKLSVCQALYTLPYYILTELKERCYHLYLSIRKLKNRQVNCLSQSDTTSGGLEIPSQGLSVNY